MVEFSVSEKALVDVAVSETSSAQYDQRGRGRGRGRGARGGRGGRKGKTVTKPK